MKTLIVYGTRYGTAAEIAEEIANVIREEGIKVDLIEDKRVNDCDVSLYDLVVVGSGIKMGKWTKKSVKFLQKNKESLANMKVAIFVSCGSANEEKTRPEGQKKYLDEVAQKNLINPPVATGLFGSVYDPEAKHGLMYNFSMRFVKKEMEKNGLDPNKRHDYRDWDDIRSWARGLVVLLKNE
ncbi:flavodoxin domain-containing protein [Methanobacterium petrolearium]|uniref:flavodoxin domain-containing protein n=1 Tax=Methanobacterium petrolearium TaxID=710190 RepID=UPI001AE614D7|nr:flavodoxin domain-containing protein [Methanobacterium petrolearium]MBP1946858.1 menaquinone-dependent protoporphyrinogen oxidase [Methanobacterium petrolearium]BDZ70470.1 flavodoxin [Methanobacterium petrolearium]